MQDSALFDVETDKLTSQLRAYAFRLLAGRDYTCAQLTQKLRTKHPLASASQIEALLETLIEDNWLNDQRFAENQVRIKSNQGQGPMKIKYTLSQAGLSSDDIKDAFDTHAPDWLTLAIHAREKKFGLALPSDYRIIMKQKRFLQSRGYSLDVINQVFMHNENFD